MTPARLRNHRLMRLVQLLSIVAVSAAASGCDRGAKPVAPTNVGAPITQAEAKAFGEAIDKAVAASDFLTIDGMLDRPAFIDLCMIAAGNPGADFRKGMEGSSFQLSQIITSNSPTGFGMVSTRTDQEGIPTALCRMLLGDRGLTYLEFRLMRRNGGVKAIDIKNLGTGVYQSQMLGELAKGGLDAKVLALLEAFKAGEYERVLSSYQSLNPKQKEVRAYLLIKMQSAQALGRTDEADAAFVTYKEKYPDEESLLLLSVDYYTNQKKFNRCLSIIDELDKKVGGDPHLDLGRGQTAVLAKDYPAAEKWLNKFLVFDPKSVDGHWAMVQLTIGTAKFGDTVQWLDRIETLSPGGIDLPTMDSEPDYAKFAKSPQYKDWRAKYAAKYPPEQEPTE